MVFAPGSMRAVSSSGSMPSTAPRTASSTLSKAVSSSSRDSMTGAYPGGTPGQPDGSGRLDHAGQQQGERPEHEDDEEHQDHDGHHDPPALEPEAALLRRRPAFTPGEGPSGGRGATAVADLPGVVPGTADDGAQRGPGGRGEREEIRPVEALDVAAPHRCGRAAGRG